MSFIIMFVAAVCFMFLIKLKQKLIRIETCNARSQLPNIQCELIG